MKCGLLLISIAVIARAQDFDVLIRSGRIADGTGNPLYTGDLGIRAGKIAALGRLEGKTAARVIDATNLTVSPGFIDILSICLLPTRVAGWLPDRRRHGRVCGCRG